MRTLRHPFLCGLLACALGALGAGPALAQSGESKIVVGNQPGGATDIVARLLTPEFSKATGRQFIVENRTGASGNIAAEYVARSAPDGNTILLVFNSHTTIAALFPKLAFDPIKDFASVGLISQTPYLAVARPDIGVDTLRELIARARRDHKPITFGSPGPGTPQHLLAEKLKQVQGVDIETAHYRGSAPAQADVMGGHVDFTLVSPSLGAQFAKSGKVKLLAVTSDARLPEFPTVPTAREQGLDTLVGSGVWLALLVPARTPAATVAHLNKVLNDALQSADLRARLATIGMEPKGGSPAALDKLMRDEQNTWSVLIRDSKITLE